MREERRERVKLNLLPPTILSSLSLSLSSRLSLSLSLGISSAPASPDQITMIIPYLTALTTYFSYGLLFAFGQLRDFFRKTIDWWSASTLQVRAFTLKMKRYASEFGD